MKNRRKRLCRVNFTQRLSRSSTKSKSNSLGEMPQLLSRTRKFSICWFFFTGWGCCGRTAVHDRACSLNSCAANSRRLRNSSEKNRASSCHRHDRFGLRVSPLVHLQCHGCGIPAQRHLRARRRVFLLHPRPQAKAIRLADPRHALRNFLPILFWCVAALSKPLLILLDQPRKLHPQEGEKLFCRRRHQKKHSREKPLRARV